MKRLHRNVCDRCQIKWEQFGNRKHDYKCPSCGLRPSRSSDARAALAGDGGGA